MKELSRRERSVLSRTVECYIYHGEPVASHQVARCNKVGLSPATVRNVMADLEEAGFLNRPHTSAGCVPTDAAFRVFVDSLQPGRRVSHRTRRFLEQRIDAMRRELVEDLEWVPKLVADVTHEAGVAVRPMGEEPVLQGLSLVRLGERRVLGIVVTVDGSVEKRVVRLQREPDRDRLQEVENALNHHLVGKSLDWIRDRVAVGSGFASVGPRAAAQGFDRDLWEVLFALFGDSCDDVEVLIAGAENLLLSTDFERIDRVRSLSLLLSDRGRIVREWKRLLRDGTTQVAIGRESEVTASGRLAMVATLFFRGGRQVGAVGVVGPRRMDYQRIVPMVEFIGDSLTRMLNEGGAAYG